MNPAIPGPEKPQLLLEAAPQPLGTPSPIETARLLRASGLSYGKVAERLGVREGTIYRWLNPEALARYRAKDDQRERPRPRRATRDSRGQRLSPEMRAWVARRKREIAGKPLTAADREQLACALDDTGAVTEHCLDLDGWAQP